MKVRIICIHIRLSVILMEFDIKSDMYRALLTRLLRKSLRAISGTYLDFLAELAVFGGEIFVFLPLGI